MTVNVVARYRGMVIIDTGWTTEVIKTCCGKPYTDIARIYIVSDSVEDYVMDYLYGNRSIYRNRYTSIAAAKRGIAEAMNEEYGED